MRGQGNSSKSKTLGRMWCWLWDLWVCDWPSRDLAAAHAPGVVSPSFFPNPSLCKLSLQFCLLFARLLDKCVGQARFKLQLLLQAQLPPKRDASLDTQLPDSWSQAQLATSAICGDGQTCLFKANKPTSLPQTPPSPGRRGGLLLPSSSSLSGAAALGLCCGWGNCSFSHCDFSSLKNNIQLYENLKEIY